jgi:hypothetical protein
LWWRISPGKSVGSSLRTEKYKIEGNDGNEINVELKRFYY